MPDGKRMEFPARVKVQAFRLAQGRCVHCTVKLGPGWVEYDHRVSDEMGGTPALENCEVLCVPCHRAKTAQDAGHLARAKRREAKHLGAQTKNRSRPIPGSRASPWKKRMNGQVLRRE
jgi:5-methylcytosine-specific restriction protein A